MGPPLELNCSPRARTIQTGGYRNNLTLACSSSSATASLTHVSQAVSQGLHHSSIASCQHQYQNASNVGSLGLPCQAWPYNTPPSPARPERFEAGEEQARCLQQPGTCPILPCAAAAASPGRRSSAPELPVLQVVCATLLYGQGPAEPGSLSVANSPSWAPPPVDLHLLPAATGQVRARRCLAGVHLARGRVRRRCAPGTRDGCRPTRALLVPRRLHAPWQRWPPSGSRARWPPSMSSASGSWTCSSLPRSACWPTRLP